MANSSVRSVCCGLVIQPSSEVTAKSCAHRHPCSTACMAESACSVYRYISQLSEKGSHLHHGFRRCRLCCWVVVRRWIDLGNQPEVQREALSA
eukprot:5010214-Amphidinium_carterae.1